MYEGKEKEIQVQAHFKASAVILLHDIALISYHRHSKVRLRRPTSDMEYYPGFL